MILCKQTGSIDLKRLVFGTDVPCSQHTILMATYFLDTSAIIKRYIFEQGQAWILSICNPAQGHDLYISQAALVEVVAAMCRRAREKSISMTERDQLITVFRQDSEQSYNIWP